MVSSVWFRAVVIVCVCGRTHNDAVSVEGPPSGFGSAGDGGSSEVTALPKLRILSPQDGARYGRWHVQGSWNEPGSSVTHYPTTALWLGFSLGPQSR